MSEFEEFKKKIEAAQKDFDQRASDQSVRFHEAAEKTRKDFRDSRSKMHGSFSIFADQQGHSFEEKAQVSSRERERFRNRGEELKQGWSSGKNPFHDRRKQLAGRQEVFEKKRRSFPEKHGETARLPGAGDLSQKKPNNP